MSAQRPGGIGWLFDSDRVWVKLLAVAASIATVAGLVIAAFGLSSDDRPPPTRPEGGDTTSTPSVASSSEVASGSSTETMIDTGPLEAQIATQSADCADGDYSSCQSLWIYCGGGVEIACDALDEVSPGWTP